MFHKFTLSLLLLAGFAASADACDRQRILAIGGGCYSQQFVAPVQHYSLGFDGGCGQQFYAQQFVQPVYGYQQPFVLRQSHGYGFSQGFSSGFGGLNLNFGNQNFRRGGRPIIVPRRGFGRGFRF